MSLKRRSRDPRGRPRSKPVPKIRFRKRSAINVTRAEFDAVVKLLNERGEIINEMRRDLATLSGNLAVQVEKNRRTLETQFTRMAQIQQELDALKRPG